MENPINMDDLGVPLFSETPIYVRRVYRGLYAHWQLDTSTKLLHDRAWHPEQWSRAPGCGLGRGWNITQLCGDYFINREIRIPSKQAGFHGKYPAAFFCFRGSDVSGQVLISEKKVIDSHDKLLENCRPLLDHNIGQVWLGKAKWS